MNKVIGCISLTPKPRKIIFVRTTNIQHNVSGWGPKTIVKFFTMIEGFEEITAKLSQEEKDLIPVFVRVLSKKVGPQLAVTAKQIEEGFWNNMQKKVTQVRVRKIMHFIRMNYLIEGLVATSKGYYVSRDPVTIMKWNKSLEQREDRIRAIRKKSEMYLVKLIEFNQKAFKQLENEQETEGPETRS